MRANKFRNLMNRFNFDYTRHTTPLFRLGIKYLQRSYRLIFFMLFTFHDFQTIPEN